MDLFLTADQESFQRTTRRYLESRMATAEVRRLAETPDGFDRSWWQGGSELGWTSLLAEEGQGLSGNGVVDLCIVAEEFGRAVAPGPLIGCNVVVSALAASKGGDHHAKVAELLATGRAVAAWAVDEDGLIWQPARPRLSAELNRGEIVLSGRKLHVEYAEQADYLLVTAQLDGRAVQCLVEAEARGLAVRPLEALDLVRRYADVEFDNVRVPEGALVGESNSEVAIERQLQLVAVLQCAEMAGAAERALEMAASWAEGRVTFGRPLNSYQALKHRFADMRTALEAIRATTAAAAAAVGADDPGAGRLASVAKAYVGSTAVEIGQESVQMHGGIGVTWDHDLHLYLRRMTSDRVLGGSPRDHVRRLGRLAIEHGEPVMGGAG